VRILLVKLSSMGDVIHNLPVVSDLMRAHPGVEIDWVTEAPYAPLVALHPGVARVLPIRLRAVKKNWWRPAVWRDLAADRAALAHADRPYDLVLDTQGLVKSAMVARWAGSPIAGFDKGVAREPMAANFYHQRFIIARDQHAVTRNRALAANALGYRISTEPDYGVHAGNPRPAWLSTGSYAVLLHATSRADKEWSRENWQALGQKLNDQHIRVVLPWGSDDEKQASEGIAAGLKLATVPPAMSLDLAAAVLASATAVIGVDTGLAHLAVALKRPTIGIYITTQPALTGLHGDATAINLGGGSREAPGAPTVDAVWQTLGPHLSHAH
jgi:heptosyltransferase-1